jgi:DNA-binding HxlR family transcriptional regulator
LFHATARSDAGVHGARYEYELTAMGEDLVTLITALRATKARYRRPGRKVPGSRPTVITPPTRSRE